MSFDVYPDGVLKSTKHVFCSCHEDEKHVTCYGCGKCYMQLLDDFNKQHEMNNKKAKYLWPDFEDRDAFILCQPSFGVLRWYCTTCENISCEKKKVVAHKSTNTCADSAIKSLQADFASMNTKLDAILKMNEIHSSCDNALSPPRKLVRVAWTGSDNEPSIQAIAPPPSSVSNATMKNKFFKKSTAQDQSQNDFVINLKVKEDCTGSSTGSILKNVHNNRNSMPEFSGRKKFNGSHDLLFKTYSDACKAKSMLDSKLNNCEIGQPKLDKLKRFNLVGFDFDMTLSEVTDSLVQENRWLNLEKTSEDTVIIKGDHKSVITVKKVAKCRNISSYTCHILMSSNMENSIGSNKLSLGYIKCKLYKQSMKRRCYRCQQDDHLAADCKNKLCCPRCSLEHRAENCESTTFKCINCKNGNKHDINHPVYSTVCPYNLSS